MFDCRNIIIFQILFWWGSKRPVLYSSGQHGYLWNPVLYCWNNKTQAGTRPAIYMCYHGDRNPRGFYSWKYSLSSVLGTQRCLRRGKKQPVQIGSCKDLFLWMWEGTSVHKVSLWCWNFTPDGEERLQRPQLCVATTFATDWGNCYLVPINLHWTLEWV